MDKNQIAAKARNCAHLGCLQLGKWVPVLSIRVVGQTSVEKPVTVGIPMYLCDYHKRHFEPNQALTTTGRMKLMMKVALSRRKKLNWDTLTVEWRTDEDAARVISANEGGSIH